MVWELLEDQCGLKIIALATNPLKASRIILVILFLDLTSKQNSSG